MINSFIFEEIIGHESLHGKIQGSDIFVGQTACLESQQLNLLHSSASVLTEHRQ